MLNKAHKKNNKALSNNADFHVSLKFIINDKKGRILILKMPQNSSMAGFYDFPGGRIRQNEKSLSFKKIIKRELREELGKGFICKVVEIPVAISRHAYAFKATNQKQYIFWVFFEAKFKGGKIILSKEHESFTWAKLTKNNVKKYFIRGPHEGINHYLTHKLS